MKFTQLIGLLLVYITAVSCAYSNHDMKELVKKNGKNKVISLKETNFERFLNGPRDYHVVLMLSSTSPQFNCPLCIEFKPEYDLVANSWFQDHPDGVDDGKDVYFLYGDFMQTKLLFQKMKMTSIPKLYYLKPSTVSTNEAWMNELDEYQFFQGQHSQLLSTWLGDLTQHKFNLYVPVNYNRVIFNAVVTFTLCVLAKVFFGQVRSIFFSKFLWIGLSIISVLLFTSGYMFTQIRQAPYVREHPDGKVEYFMAGQQMQLGIETQIVSFGYGILSLLFVALVKKIPQIKHPKVQLIATATVSLSIYVGFSFLLSFFGMKSPGYPFRFLKFV